MRPLFDELEKGSAWTLGGEELPVRVDFVVRSEFLLLDALLQKKETGIQLRLVWQFLAEISNVSNRDAS